MHCSASHRRRTGGSPRARATGFTLIELLIAVAVVGILAAIAYPAYQNSVRKSRRADAKTALLDLAQREERYMAQYSVYTDDATKLGYSSAFPLAVQSGGQSYYSIAKPTLTNSNAAFSATATPSGGQASDSCGSYTIDNTGAQSVSGSSSGTSCW